MNFGDLKGLIGSRREPMKTTILFVSLVFTTFTLMFFVVLPSTQSQIGRTPRGWLSVGGATSTCIPPDHIHPEDRTVTEPVIVLSWSNCFMKFRNDLNQERTIFAGFDDRDASPVINQRVTVMYCTDCGQMAWLHSEVFPFVGGPQPTPSASPTPTVTPTPTPEPTSTPTPVPTPTPTPTPIPEPTPTIEPTPTPTPEPTPSPTPTVTPTPTPTPSPDGKCSSPRLKNGKCKRGCICP